MASIAGPVGEGERRRESWRERRRHREKDKMKKASFDISLPAQHLVHVLAVQCVSVCCITVSR